MMTKEVKAILSKATALEVKHGMAYVHLDGGDRPVFCRVFLTEGISDGYYVPKAAAMGRWITEEKAQPVYADYCAHKDQAPKADARAVSIADYLYHAPFASDDSTRYFMCCVAVYPDAMAATDGRRLVCSSWAAEYISADARLVPAHKKLSAIIKALHFTAGAAPLMHVGRTHATIESTSIHLVMANVEGQYPNIARVFPEDCTLTVNLPSARWLEDVIKLRRATKGNLDYRIEYAAGQWHDAHTDPQDAPELAFNASYILDAVKGGVSILQGSGPGKAWEGRGKNDTRHIIMPLVLDRD